MKAKAILACTLLAFSSCTVTLLGDLEVEWELESSTSSALCSTYGVDYWLVEIVGPDRVSADFTCGSAWNSGTVFYGVAEGAYTVTVSAMDANNATLAHRSTTAHVINGSTVEIVGVGFVAADFSGTYCGDSSCNGDETCTSCPADCGECSSCGDALCDSGETCTSCPADCGECPGMIKVYWNINGTQDGAATGLSWDTCDEVGAASVEVLVDGTAQTFDCSSSGSMSKSIEVEPGDHTLKARLLDASNTELTTETPAATIKVTTSTPGEFVADFYWDSFYNPVKSDTTGNFWFATSYESGKKCTETNPNVSQQVTLLKLNGSAVVADVCDPYGGCKKTSGAYPEGYSTCFDADVTQKILNVTWGNYKIVLEGALAGASPDVCWEAQNTTGNNEVDILVGAGETNPLVLFDLTRISSSGNCAPF